MIIYKDVITGDELLSDNFKIIDVGDGLWEVNLQKVTKRSDDFVLEAAIPSAEGVDAEEGGDGEDTGSQKVLDIVDHFRLFEMTEETYKPDLKQDLPAYVKRLNNALKAKEEAMSKSEEAGVSKSEEEEVKKSLEFRSVAPAALKRLKKNASNFDVFMGASTNPEGMFVLVDYREDGITPYATYWKHGLEAVKV